MTRPVGVCTTHGAENCTAWSCRPRVASVEERHADWVDDPFGVRGPEPVVEPSGD